VATCAANPDGKDPEIHASHAGGISLPGVASTEGLGEGSGDVVCDAAVVGAGGVATVLEAPGRSIAHAKRPTNTATITTKISRRLCIPVRLGIHQG
jgi:hypothetical protein